MARTDLNTTPDAAPDALSLLTRDHRLVQELFAEFDRATSQQLDPLARRICKMLRVHTQIEEEIFYPAARRALNRSELIDTAERDHAEANQSIMRVESMTSDDAGFKAAVSALAAQVAGHIGREEEQLFPHLREAGIDLLAIGFALAERRDTLLDVLGLHDDDEEGAANQRETREATPPDRPAFSAPER